MPGYEYQCQKCGFSFEKQQAITDSPVTKCPECMGEVRRLLSGGVGLIFKDGAHADGMRQKSCSLERDGITCCGRKERCDESGCES
jgi:putative FmdB family regulatory protein